MTSITLNEFINTTQTGDILLYSTSLWYSRIIEYFQGSKFSHIGIILKDPVYINEKLKGLYILESGSEDIPDPTDDKLKFGVQITPLEHTIKSYQNSWMGNLYYRRLDCLRDQQFTENIKKIYHDVHNRPYDIDLSDWIKADLKLHIGNEHKTNTFWCSALVSYIYCKMKFLKNIPWTIISPKNFSYYEDNETLKFINSKLAPEKNILL